MKSSLLIALLTSLLTFLFFNPAQAASTEVDTYVDPVDKQPLKGWHGPMKEFEKQLDPDKNYVVAILHRPVNAFLMQNMYHFKNTLVASRSGLQKNATGKLGHFQVAWACRKPGDKKRRIGMTGQTGENSNQGSQMLLEGGYGMSLFFANFIDGYLQSSYSQSQRILKSSKSYGFEWVAVEISEDDCDFGLSYLDTYITRRSYTNFSFVKDPADFQGGGCTSFGSELFFQFGGVSPELINKWPTTLHVPKSYMANPSKSELPADTRLPDWLNKKRYTKKKAGLFSIAYLPNFSLKKNKIPAKIYDTEKILYSFREITRRALKKQPKDFPADYKIDERRAYGLERDKRMKTIKSGAIFHSIAVDESYHKDFKKIKKHIKSKPTPNLKVGEINGVPGAIFEKAAW